MRLIDADALKWIISKNVYLVRDYLNSTDYGMFWTGGIEVVIDAAPTIDAEPVVRCKDCKHFADDYVDTGFGPIPAFSCDVCELYGAGLSLNHYCAYGEREDDETD